MPVEESDKGLESKNTELNEPGLAVRQEVNAGKAELAQGHVQYIKDLKEGVRRSGISQLLGKPKFFDSKDENPTGKDAAEKTDSDISKEKQAQTFNTGERSRVALNELRAQFGFSNLIGKAVELAKEDPRKLGDLGHSKADEARKLGDLGQSKKPESAPSGDRQLGNLQANQSGDKKQADPRSLGDLKPHDAGAQKDKAISSIREVKPAFSQAGAQKAFFHPSVTGLFGKPEFFDSKNDAGIDDGGAALKMKEAGIDDGGAALKAKAAPFEQAAEAVKPRQAERGIFEQFNDASEKLVKKVESFSKNVSPEMLLANNTKGDTTGQVKGDAAGKVKGDAGSKNADAQIENQTPELQKIKDAKVQLSPEQERQLNDDLAQISKLPEAQRKKVLESLDKIAQANASEGTKLDDKQKAELICSLAHQIAHPESIKQGAKDTCVSANVEKTLAMTHPEKYADMVAKLATTGEYTTPDGKTTMKAQLDANGKLAELSDPGAQRSATSELMQTAITNLGMPEGETYKSYKPGKEPIPEGVKKDEDSGERVLGADGKEKRFEGLSRGAKEDILNKLLPDDGYQARKIQSPDDLGQAWKDNGGTPPLHVTVRINAEHTGMGSARDGAAGTHAVVITHIEFGPDGKPTQIYYENTADSADHSYPNGKPVPADEFVKSMQGERSHQYKDGSVDAWPEPMTATVRTDGKEERQSKAEAAKNEDLDKAVEEFRDSTHKDAWFFDYGTDREQMAKALQGRPRWEIEEINRRYKEKYGVSLDEEIVDELQGRERVQYRQLLKGKDTQTQAPPPVR